MGLAVQIPMISDGFPKSLASQLGQQIYTEGDTP
jgi:hypothetical protein